MKTPNMKKPLLSVTTKLIRTKLLSLTFLACVLCSANNVSAQNAYAGTYPGFMPATPTHPEFYSGEISLGSGWYYLQFANGTPFGYYAYFSPDESQLFIYHLDMGFERVFDANDANHGIFFYDFASRSVFYTSPNTFPYLYDFSLNAWLYYLPDANNPGRYTNNPRWFFNFATGQWINL